MEFAIAAVATSLLARQLVLILLAKRELTLMPVWVNLNNLPVYSRTHSLANKSWIETMQRH